MKNKKNKKTHCGGTVLKFFKKKGESDKMTARIPGLIQRLQ
jgi:hypothetical protein